MRQKLKAFVLPIFIMIIGISALFIHQLFEVKKTPQENWSRSLPLDYASDEKPLFFLQDKNLFISNKNKIEHFSVQDGLTIEKVKDIPTKVTRGYPFWTDGSQTIMIKDSNLVSTKNNKDTVLDNNVTGIAIHHSHIIYWKNEKAYTLNLENQTSKEIHQFESEIHNVYIADDGSAIFAVMKDDVHASLYYLDETGSVLKDPFFTISQSPNDRVEGLVFSKQNDTLHLLYNHQSRTQGTIAYKINKLSVSLNDDKDSNIKPQEVSFLNEESNAKLEAPRSAKIVEIDGKKNILFTAESHRIDAKNAISLYLAPYTKGTDITAKPISTTKNFGFAPIRVAGDSLVWFDYDGDSYELFGASQDKNVVAASKEWTDRSVKEGINNAVLMLFSSLITVLTSFYWVLPSLFLLILLYIFKPNAFEKDDINWVEYASIIIFLVMPITFISRAQSEYFHSVAPNYFSFTGSSWVWLLIISVISGLIWKYGRNPEWGTFAGAFYFMGAYILIFITSIGPYLFNLY
ncbi:hypothetical protein [Bacillus seohaeanensis]|uniref:DUF5050 domain-containing protein n=1 Tax=Bacillus seohaeanensis TaxID=284580 RepID=A0ABW5RQ16_9BACI